MIATWYLLGVSTRPVYAQPLVVMIGLARVQQVVGCTLEIVEEISPVGSSAG